MVVVRRHDAQGGHAALLRAGLERASVAEAVVVAEYCGYIGKTIRRSTPWPDQVADDHVATDGLPTCMPKRDGHVGEAACCSSSVWRRVQCSSGEPVWASQMRRYLAADRGGRKGRMNRLRMNHHFQRRHLDDARVAEELAEVGPEGLRRSGRRACRAG